MPTIRIEYEVPDDDCENCYYCIASYGKCFCVSFNRPCGDVIRHGYGFRVKRCQACIDAEVKEGVYAK